MAEQQQRRASPAILLALVVAPFALLLGAEVAAIILVASLIGWWTLAVMAGTSVLGMVLFVHEGRKNFTRLRDAVELGREPGARLGDAMLIFIGAILLILPGFVTDVVGLAFILPFTRPLVRRAFSWWLTKTGRPVADPRITTIPGEVVEEEPTESNDGPLVLEGTVVEQDEDDRQ